MGHATVRRLVATTLLMLVGSACTAADGDAGAAGPRPATPPATAAADPSTPPEPTQPEQIVDAYHAYTGAVSEALGAGHLDSDAARDVMTGRAVRDARARVAANARAGVHTSGGLTPSATVADVQWDGGDTARVDDCVLNGLAYEANGAVATEATGTRRPVEARLKRIDGRWVVSRVEMPQDTDSDNPQTDPPFLRGPMPDGPPSCAPPDIEQAVLAGYQAFWDAFDRAFGFGRDGPADPDDPALAETSVDPQLSDTRKAFRALQRRNRTSRGAPDIHDSWLLATTDFDEVALVADCVSLMESQTVDLDSGDVVSTNNVGQVNYYEARVVMADGSWKVQNWEIRGEGVTECDAPS